MAFQITYHRQGTTQELHFEGDRIEIGRGEYNDFKLSDLRVGWHHATIERMGTAYVLIDNAEDDKGTYVNGRVIETYQLANNDRIRIGHYTLRIRLPQSGGPLGIEVEEPRTPSRIDDAKPVAYRDKHKLKAGGVSKGRLVALGALLVLLLSSWAFSSWYIEDKWASKVTHLLSPGAVSNVHHFIENDCQKCHAETWQAVERETCEMCHAGTEHYANQNPEMPPTCTACHQEHRGRDQQISRVPDRDCTQCHADLKDHELTQQVAFKVVGEDGLAIRSFAKGHPEFAVPVRQPTSSESKRIVPEIKRLRLNHPEMTDTARFKFDHQAHLGPLPKDEPTAIGSLAKEQLKCNDCHRTDPQGVYMQPIDYERDCQRCHRLEFDDQLQVEKRIDGKLLLRGEVVRHDKPERIHEFLLSRYFQSCRDQAPDRMEKKDEQKIKRFMPGRTLEPPEPEEKDAPVLACLYQKVSQAEDALFDQEQRRFEITKEVLKHLDSSQIPPDVVEKLQAMVGQKIRGRKSFLTHLQNMLDAEPDPKHAELLMKLADQSGGSCWLCHEVNKVSTSNLGAASYRIEPPEVPHRWFAYGGFSHDVHARAGKKCEDCHEKAVKSKKRDDLLLPGIATCQDCHSVSGGARNTCVTCHGYHGEPAATSEASTQTMSER